MKKTLAALAVLSLAISAAHATNGYFASGYGTRLKGLAGAGSALATDPMITANNPAGGVLVGNSFDAGIELFSPERKYTVTGNPSGYPGTFGLAPGTVKSGHSLFVMPHASYNHMLDDESAVSAILYGNGGMNTEWPATGGGTFYGGAAGVNLEQMFLALTYSRKFAKVASFGVSPIIAYQRFYATGLSQFAGFVADGTPDNLTNNGTDNSTGVGVRLGVQGQVAEGLTAALAYQPKIRMSRFKDYSDLFAQQGRFDIPASATLGLAYQVTPAGVLAFDLQEIWYSDVPAVANKFGNLFTGMSSEDPSYFLGGDKGAGFGWRNVTAYKLGYEHTVSPELTVRGGMSYARQPIPDSEVLFNILAPGVEEWHFAAGASYAVGKDAAVNAAFTYVPNVSVSGANPMEAPGQQTIELEMSQWDLEVGYSVRF